jgi:soluble lytic murein transglycosylase-like protein
MRRRAALALAVALALSACAGDGVERRQTDTPALAPGASHLHGLISEYARLYDVPEDLVHRVVQRESSYNPGARNGPYYGLMQIHPQTARTMGHAGTPADLLDAETNLRYAVKYLRGAWMVSDGSRDRAVHWYSSGYYYEAKRRGLLQATGLK